MNDRNRLRWRTVQASRDFKSLFFVDGAPRIWLRVLSALLLALIGGVGGREAVRRWCYRTVFTVDGDTRRIAADHVLADLRDFTFARTSAFDPDPIIMARRQGRRDVWLRISAYLNLDEAQVQTLMEIDDGI